MIATLLKRLLQLIGLVLIILVGIVGVSWYIESRPVPKEEESALIESTILELTDILHHQYDHASIGTDETWRKTKFLRDTHPKANACVRANFSVEPNLPPELAIGVFKGPSDGSGKYKAWLRFSNSANMVAPDADVDFRGIAIKLMGVDGERLPVPGDEQHTQDFLFIGNDAFFAGNIRHFHDFFAACKRGGYACTPTSLPFVWNLLIHPHGAYNLLTGRKAFAAISDIFWFSVAPYTLQETGGPSSIIKYGAFPCDGKKSRWDAPGTSPNYLTERLAEELDPAKPDSGVCLDFMVQIRADDSQPIDTTLVAWDKKKSPWHKIGRLDIYPQAFQSPEQWAFCQNLTYNPWHGLAAHTPLGDINRARRDVMKAMQDVRLRENGNQRFEPTGNEVFFHGAEHPWLTPAPSPSAN
ncbi:MAG: hypothetical protein ABI411_18815 [Tahibacter sp.]